VGRVTDVTVERDQRKGRKSAEIAKGKNWLKLRNLVPPEKKTAGTRNFFSNVAGFVFCVVDQFGA
jgi:hypothetical protein